MKKLLSHCNKKIVCRFLIVAAFLACICVAAFALKATVTSPSTLPADATIVTTTERDTSSDNQTDAQAPSESQPEDTTKKQSWFDKLFGNKDTEKQKATEPGQTEAQEESNPDAETEPYATVPDEENSQDTTSLTQTDILNPEGFSSSGSTTAKNEEATEAVPTTAPKQEGDFTYTVVDGSVKLLGYTGNSSVVRVPAEIDGKHVAYLGKNVFSDKSSITSIIFEGSTSGSEKFYLPYNTTVFNSLPNLISVTLPFETNNYFVNGDGSISYIYSFGALFSSCPKVSSIDFGEHINSMISPNMSRMFSIDGVVFVNTSSELSLIWYPTAKTQADYIVPDNVRKIEKNAFSNNAYVESITLSVKVKSIASPNFKNCSKLSSFAVAEGNSSFTSSDGVLYYASSTSSGTGYLNAFYPPAKTDEAFIFPADNPISFESNTFCGNPYLKEITIPDYSKIDGSMLSSDLKPLNLEKIFAWRACLIPTSAEALYTIEYFD